MGGYNEECLSLLEDWAEAGFTPVAETKHSLLVTWTGPYLSGFSLKQLISQAPRGKVETEIQDKEVRSFLGEYVHPRSEEGVR